MKKHLIFPIGVAVFYICLFSIFINGYNIKTRSVDNYILLIGSIIGAVGLGFLYHFLKYYVTDWAQSKAIALKLLIGLIVFIVFAIVNISLGLGFFFSLSGLLF